MSTKTTASPFVAVCGVCGKERLSKLEKANGGVHEYCRSLTGRSRARSTTNTVVAS
ncbi:hypothetical protein [Nocardia phage KYD2]|nr:hypothetical protein [Nocardia phage KYD2]